ncbi:MAG: hypothetical protein ABI556_11295 [Gemmatimonadales bacterium]
MGVAAGFDSVELFVEEDDDSVGLAAAGSDDFDVAAESDDEVDADSALPAFALSALSALSLAVFAASLSAFLPSLP